MNGYIYCTVTAHVQINCSDIQAFADHNNIEVDWNDEEQVDDLARETASSIYNDGCGCDVHIDSRHLE